MQLTVVDAGATIAVRVGATVDLTLASTDTRWGGVNVTPAGLLTELAAPHGSLARWTAAEAGTAKVTATGTASCPPAVACPMWARWFAVTLAIS